MPRQLAAGRFEEVLVEGLLLGLLLGAAGNVGEGRRLRADHDREPDRVQFEPHGRPRAAEHAAAVHQLENEHELFDYRRPERAAAEDGADAKCFVDFFAAQKAHAGDGYFQLGYETTNELIACFMQMIVDSLKQQAAESGGTITVTPSDRLTTCMRCCETGCAPANAAATWSGVAPHSSATAAAHSALLT